MANRFVAATMVLLALMFSHPALAQNAQGPPRIPFPAPDPGAPPVDRSQEKHLDGWYKDSPIMPADPKAAPAPRHDLSGIWEPAAGWLAGVQFMGAQEYPSDGKHFLPFTSAGEEAFKTHKAGFGTNEVPIALNNDPFDMCDPIGFPRIELFNLRAIQILQTPKQVMILYQNDRTFRSIWTDGRGFPDPDISEPRWYGYSIGAQDIPKQSERTVFLTHRKFWLASGGFNPSKGSIPPDKAAPNYIKDFRQQCPKINVTDGQGEADYAVTIDQGGLFQPHVGTFQVAVYSRNAGLIYMGGTNLLKNAIKDACNAIGTIK